MEVQVLTTTEGKPMLCIENYLYVKNKNLVNKIRWDCLKKNRLKIPSLYKSNHELWRS